MYSVPPGAGYTVDAEGHGNGIVKVTFDSCLTTGQTVQLPLQVGSRGSTQGGAITAAWKVMKNGDATLAFDPQHVTFDGPATQDATLSITPNGASAKGVFLRLKLDPANGSGLGEGPGVMVRIACVVNPAPTAQDAAACPPATPTASAARADHTDDETGHGRAGEEHGRKVGQADDDPLTPLSCENAATAPDITAPTTGSFIQVQAARAQGNAACVATPRRLRIHRAEQTTLRVTVRPNGIPVRGSIVRVTTPDGAIRKSTDGNGAAVFRIRPSRGGEVVIQADACFGADRIRVRAARVATRAAASPRFTG